MIKAFILVACTAFLTGALPAHAQQPTEIHLPIEGQIAPDGRSVALSWFGAEAHRVGSVAINRRILGAVGGETWTPITDPLIRAMRFDDDNLQPGVAYEYQVIRTERDIVDVGYWTTGTELPAQPTRGHAYLVIDETHADALAPYIARFEGDLIGDGWQVTRLASPRGDARQPIENIQKAAALKEALSAHYAADPFGQHAVILIGHVPIVLSGNVNPDGHDAQPHATDLFYANTDGRWRINQSGVLLDAQLPSNAIEMQIGRIDFSTVSGGDLAREQHLLRAYFDKNHHWRHGLIGDLRAAYGKHHMLKSEISGLRNIVGPDALTSGGHHDVGEQMPWLWGVDFGDWKGANYANMYSNKAVFAINFGSHKQKIQNRDNPMAALLAQPWYTIAVGWGARPAWWLHHMALGGTIGDVHMRTVNNGVATQPYRDSMDYYPTGQYLWRNPIWVNLLGDPTTHGFVLAPARDVLVADGTVTWTVSDDPDVLGYRIYRAENDSTDYTLISGESPVIGSHYTDPTALPNARYMVRAYGLKQVHAGSFYTLSQGSFADAGLSKLAIPSIQINSTPDQVVRMPKPFDAPDGDTIYAFIEGPEIGDLSHDGTGWRYAPPQGFSGAVTLRFSVSHALQTQQGLLTILISP